MRTFRTYGLMFSMLLLGCPVLASEEQASPISQRWASWFSGHEPTDQKQITAPLYQANLTQAVFASPVAPRLRDLTPETDRPRTQNLLASMTWMKGSVVTETEVANNQGGAGWLAGRIAGDTRDDAANRMLRIGLTGANGVFRYGMTYRNAGQAFYNGPDQAAREVWGEWRRGSTTLRSAIGQQWNNVASDSARSRMEQTYGRIGLTWNRPAWPTLSLTYAKNSLNSALDPIGIAPQRMSNHTLEASLAYHSARWNAQLASSYIVGTDLLRNGAGNHVKMQMLTAAFRPLNTLTIAPTLAYRAEQQEWSGVRIDSPSASLALHYKQSRRLLISAMGNYAGTRSSDRLVDQENVGGKSILTWDFQTRRQWTTLVSLEAAYNRVTNHATPSADTEDLSGLVRLVVATL